MKTMIVFLIMLMGLEVPGQAISKEEFLNLSYEGRRNFSVIMGTYSSEYAIPREEFLKLPLVIRSAINREKTMKSCQYAIKNLGKKQKDLDISILYDLSMSGDVSHYAEDVMSYARAAGFCENHLKLAEYYYKDYLEWKKSELGQPSLWKHPGGDGHPLSSIVGLYSDYDMYKEWDALYADYNEFWWKRYAAAECRLRTDAGPDCVEKWLEEAEDYQAFLEQWTEIKQKAKTVKPKPLPLPVQMHEDFYSADVKKVLGALEYYRNHKVRFMVEKALKDKRPDVVKKAKEYLDNWDKPAGQSAERNSVGRQESGLQP